MTTASTESDVRVVPISVGEADVRLRVGSRLVSIGRVTLTNGRWCWRHRDGEQSSPIADNRTDAAAALAIYHATFKVAHRPVRRLLFA